MLIKIQGVLQLHFQFKKVGRPHAMLESEANTVRSIIESEKRTAAPPLQRDVMRQETPAVGKRNISKG